MDARQKKSKLKALTEWRKAHPIIRNNNGKFCMINTSNSLQEYDAKKEELENFELSLQQDERDDEIDVEFDKSNIIIMNDGENNDDEEEEEELTQRNVINNIVFKRHSILQQIENIQMTLQRYQSPDDDKIQFTDQSNATKGEFARAFSLMCSTLRLNNTEQITLLEFMQKFNPYQALPIRTSNFGNTISTVQNYVPPSNRLLKFDACVAGCVVFVDKRYEHLRRCPTCNLKRYNKCILASCKSIPYDECPHSDIGREATSFVYYRPIIPLLIKLLEKPDFIVALNYKFIKQNENNYEDVQDGQHYKDNYSEMDTIFSNFCRNDTSKNKWTKVNILICQFYDGVKLFDHKVVDFWPLLITILNLPPTIRNQIGVGTFLLSTFSNSTSSEAERYLFENCFIAELLELYNGITINNTYFVQVRLIQHCLDTKALGKQLNCQEATSICGCPFCRVLPGSSRYQYFKKVVYSGFRILLPEENLVRFIGRSRLCCPPGFYGTSSNVVEVEKHKQNNIEAYNAYSVNLKKIVDNLKPNYISVYDQRLMRSKQFIFSCIPNSETTNLQIQRFYLETQQQNNKPTEEPFYQWFHSQEDDTTNPYHHSKFSGAMYFVHCDLRPVVDLMRRTQIEFENDGMAADNLSKRIPIKDRHVNGVKGSWPFKILPYANVKYQVCYDGFHCLFGIAKHIVLIVKGDKATNGFQQYCKETKTFSTFFNNNNVPPIYPWILTPVEQSKVDAWIDAILIPKSYSESFQMDRLFAATGYVRGKTFIDVFSILIDYLNLAMSTIPEEYRNFFSMLGSEFRELLAFSFCDEKIEELHHKIIETLCVYEGLFSEKECQFMFHEILHLSRHIPIMGPLHGWWTYSGERSMSFIKKFVPIGGRAFEKSCIEAYNHCESAITEETAFRSNFYENDVRFSFNEINQQLEFNFQLFYFFTPICFKKPKYFPEFNNFEQECLIKVLLTEIFKIADNHLDALQRSSFYRLFNIFNKTKNYNNKQSKCSFKTWLYLVSLYDGGNEGCKKNFPLNEDEKELLTRLERFIEGSSKYDNNNNNTKEEGNNNKYNFIKKTEIKTANSIVELLEIQNNFKIYKNAVIYGKRFSARDVSYSEKAQMIKDPKQYGSSLFRYKTSNEKNNLQTFENWSMTDDHSSWCRYRISSFNYRIDGNKYNELFNSTNINDCYGRLNYFFRINCETDDILHGLGIANVAPRICSKIKLVDRIPCDEYINLSTKELNNSCNTFIPITNIYPTPILISPFDKNDLPIVIKHKTNLLKKNQYSDTNKLSYFLANDLKPSEIINKEQQRIFDKMKYKINNNSSNDQ
jgi:hypothetical protein